MKENIIAEIDVEMKAIAAMTDREEIMAHSERLCDLKVALRVVYSLPSTTITVNRRTNDWHASLGPGYWECGKTSLEAIGNLVISCAKTLGLRVVLDKRE